jgi:hypothetical protein
MVEIACPRCNSTDVVASAGDTYTCNHCHTKFFVERGRARMQGEHGGWTAGQAPPVAHAPSQAPSGRGAVVAVAVAGVLAVGIAGAVLTTVRQTMETQIEAVTVPVVAGAPPKAAAPNKPKSKGGVVEVKPVPHGKAELRGTVNGKVASTGAHFWLTTYANVGETPIDKPAVVVSLFDESGARTGEQAGWAEREVLEPGESAPVLVMVGQPPTYSRAEVTPREPTPPRYPSKQMPVVVTEHTVQAQAFGNRRSVIGTVKNEREGTLKFVKIVAVGRDAAGKIVSYATSFATKKVLGAGEESGFKVDMGTFELAEPVRYELSAMGRQAQ